VTAGFEESLTLQGWRILWQNTQTGALSYWTLDETKTIATGVFVPSLNPDWQPFGTPDLDRDGQKDILFHNSRTGDVSFWRMRGTMMLGSGVFYSGVPLQWVPVGTPDLNGDGAADIIWQNTVTGDVTYWTLGWSSQTVKITGTGTIATAVPLGWRIKATPDLNGDGNADLLWQNTQQGIVSYWLLNGTHTVSMGVVQSQVPSDWQIVGYSGDKKVDIVWRNSAGRLTYWTLDGLHVAGYGDLASSVPTEWLPRCIY